MLRLLLAAVMCAVVTGDDETLSVSCDFAIKVDCSAFSSNPLCASDDKTYDNECHFAQQHCLHPMLHVEHTGACGNPVTGTAASGQEVTFAFFCKSLQHMPCSDDHIVLCGSDGNTYPNVCEFEKAKCSNYGLEIFYIGACPV